MIDIIVSGQELDLRRFAGGSKDAVKTLETFDEAEDYTYRVAGCVGEFWTEMCQAHLFSQNPWDLPAQRRDGVRLGQGLQWVNILRDLPKDLSNGRCYLPAQELIALGLSPADLAAPKNWNRLRPLYERLVTHAASHLEEGWRYTRSIPRGSIRLRMACAVPVLIGLQTLEKCRAANPLDPRVRIKVTRGFVRSAVIRSLFASLGWQQWDTLYKWARRVAR